MSARALAPFCIKADSVRSRWEMKPCFSLWLGSGGLFVVGCSLPVEFYGFANLVRLLSLRVRLPFAPLLACWLPRKSGFRDGLVSRAGAQRVQLSAASLARQGPHSSPLTQLWGLAKCQKEMDISGRRSTIACASSQVRPSLLTVAARHAGRLRFLRQPAGNAGW